MGSRGLIAAVFVLLLAPAAIADQQVVATTPNTYVNPNVTIDQGEPLTFRNNDIVMHDVTATDGGDLDGHLFKSDLIGSGETSFVEGSQYLTTGTYSFYCSAHAQQMKGTLTVTANGTPKPRPGSGGGGGSTPAPDTTAPTLTLSAHAAKAKSLKKGGELKVDLGADEAAKLALTVKLGSLTARTVKLELGSAGTRKLAFTLNAKARKKVRKGTTLKLSLTGTDAAGNAGSAAASLKLG